MTLFDDLGQDVFSVTNNSVSFFFFFFLILICNFISAGKQIQLHISTNGSSISRFENEYDITPCVILAGNKTCSLLVFLRKL